MMIPAAGNRVSPVAAVVAALTCALLQGARAGVVEDFNHQERCKDFLYMGTPPRGYLGNSFTKICQRYEEKPRYVTVYDPRKHIPVYSAYTFKKSDGEKKVDFPWMFEPQVSVLPTPSPNDSQLKDFFQLEFQFKSIVGCFCNVYYSIFI